MIIIFQCPEKKCNAGGSRVHSLTLKSNRLCLHAYLIIKAGLTQENQKEVVEPRREFNRGSTIDLVLDLIMEYLPTATEDNSDFLHSNKNFVDQLCKKTDISAELTKYVPRVCPKCSGYLMLWKHKTKNSFIVSLGDIKKVKIPVKHCVKCNLLLYPQLYDVGLIPLHNKFLISFDYLLELSFLLDSGISMIEVIKNKVNLLCQREGLQFKPDHNTSSTIERFAVAINAVLITGISN